MKFLYSEYIKNSNNSIQFRLQTNFLKKYIEYLSSNFTKEENAQKLMKRCLIALVIREMQIQTSMRHCLDLL